MSLVCATNKDSSSSTEQCSVCFMPFEWCASLAVLEGLIFRKDHMKVA